MNPRIETTNEFERWATIEIENFNEVPTEIDTNVLSLSLYLLLRTFYLSNNLNDG